MAQRKQLTWTELRVGLFVLVALFVIAVGIFYVTGAGFFGAEIPAADLFAGSGGRFEWGSGAAGWSGHRERGVDQDGAGDTGTHSGEESEH